jgi:hypothetical protein
LWLQHQVGNARHRFDRLLHLLSFSAKEIQIVAVNLDANLSLDSGKHVRNQMRNRLFNCGDDTGNIGHRFTNFVDLFFPRAM